MNPTQRDGLTPAQMQQLYAASRAGGGSGGINPAMFQQFAQQQQQQGQGAFNPAMLMRQMQQQQQQQQMQSMQVGVSPAQLLQSMNGGGGGSGNMMNAGFSNEFRDVGTNMNGIGSMNPAQMMSMMNGSGGGNASMNGGGMNAGNFMNMNMNSMGGINPAALMGGASSPTHSGNNASFSMPSGNASPTAPQAQISPSASASGGMMNAMQNSPSPSGPLMINPPSTPQLNMSGGQNPRSVSTSPQNANPSFSMNGMNQANPHSAGGLASLGLSQMQIAQLAQMPPAERERHVTQFRMLQAQRMMMMREQQQQQQQLQGGMSGQGQAPIPGMMNAQGVNANMGSAQGMGGMHGMSQAQLQQLQQQQAHERFQQLSQGQYDQQRPSSAASTGSHSQRLAQSQGQGQGMGQQQTHPGHHQNAQLQQPNMQIPQHPFPNAQNMTANPSANYAGAQNQNQNQQQSSMMPPPMSIPPRPPTASSHRPQQGGAYTNIGAPSPRPNTSGGPSATPSPRVPSGPLPGGNIQGPVPIQPRPMTGAPASTGRPGTSMSMHSNMGGQDGGQNQGQQKVPSRPATAAGYAQQLQPEQIQSQQAQQQAQQQGQNGVFLSVNTANGAPQTQGAKSPGGYAPIAPAPTQPGSPVRGAKRKAGGTPIPGQQPQQLQSQSQAQPQAPPQSQQAPGPPQTPRLPMPPIHNVGSGPNGMSGGTGLTGMGIMGNVGPVGQSQMSVGMGLLGGAGGGMMGPPVLPRSSSQGQIQQPTGGDMGMNLNLSGNGTFPGPGMVRQMSAGALNVNPGFPSLSLNPAAGLASTSPIQNSAVDPMVASRAMANLTNGMGLGINTPTVGSIGGIDVPIPQMPMQQQIRQKSQPPVQSPFQHSSSPSIGSSFSGMMGVQERKPGLPDGVGLGTSTSQTGLAEGTESASAKPAAGANGLSSSTSTSAPNIIPQLPPLPANVQLNPKVTRVSVVPLKESLELILPLADHEIDDIKMWMKIDKEYDLTYKHMRERMAEELRETVGKPRAWWEKDAAAEDARMNARRRPEKFNLTGLKQAKEKERKKAGRREGFKLPRRLAPEDADRPEQLVPIRLEFDVEHHKMRDTFVWNLNDPIITPEIFAQSIVDDYNLAPSYHAVITKAIQDQLSDFKAHSTTFGEDGLTNLVSDPEDVRNGELDEKDAEWWEAWRTTVRSESAYKRINKRGDNRSRKRRKLVKEEIVEHADLSRLPGSEVPMSVDDFEDDEDSMHEEMRILVKLDIIVGSLKLEDQFEWNLENNDPSPERFAEIYAKDLGLGGEFKTAIAHSIREQVQIYQKSLFLVGHPSDGSAVQDDDLRMSLLPSLSTGARAMDQVGAFTPILSYLSDSEIEKNEKEREKELNRRRRKTTRGRRGIALPDREPPKTFRTPAIGFPEIDAATLAMVNAAAAPTSRRAAAAAASLTIANMVASENGTVLLPSNHPAPLTPITPVTPKEKKPKGLFKAPSYPSTVLRPRAQLRGSTPSTAADISSLPPPLENDLPLPSSSAAPDSRGARVVLTAKRAKELEREAKEKEYADGQHANMIDGVWHCSNCGCPEHIAIGRRKGPLGDKSQCGTCGKFWHRHRRPRPVEYNASAEYHLNLVKEAEQARIAAKRKRPQAAVVEEQPAQNNTDDADVEPETPIHPNTEVWVEVPPGPQQSTVSADAERPASPISTASSASESPLAHRMSKSNGVGHSKSAPPDPAPQDLEPEMMSSAAAPPAGSPPPPRPSAPPHTHQSTPMPIPQWLKQAMVEMQAKYPHDNFEVIARRGRAPATVEWRIKCLDCPGKLYTPGPGETLSNYEVHLKNRLHRQKVNARVGFTTA